jgi:uncharacterized protein DUF2188
MTIEEMIAHLRYEVNYGLGDYGGMPRARYFVVNNRGRWAISFQQQHYGPYATRQEAINYAVDAAHRSHSQGIDAQVLVQGEDGRFRTEWTYGNDPYPPPG